MDKLGGYGSGSVLRIQSKDSSLCDKSNVLFVVAAEDDSRPTSFVSVGGYTYHVFNLSKYSYSTVDIDLINWLRGHVGTTNNEKSNIEIYSNLTDADKRALSYTLRFAGYDHYEYHDGNQLSTFCNSNSCSDGLRHIMSSGGPNGWKYYTDMLAHAWRIRYCQNNSIPLYEAKNINELDGVSVMNILHISGDDFYYYRCNTNFVLPSAHFKDQGYSDMIESLVKHIELVDPKKVCIVVDSLFIAKASSILGHGCKNNIYYQTISIATIFDRMFGE